MTIAEWLAAVQAEVTSHCVDCEGIGLVYDGDPIPFDCSLCKVELMGFAAVVTVNRCTCAPVDNGAGFEHEPHCGSELIELMPVELRDEQEVSSS